MAGPPGDAGVDGSDVSGTFFIALLLRYNNFVFHCWSPLVLVVMLHFK